MQSHNFAVNHNKTSISTILHWTELGHIFYAPGSANRDDVIGNFDYKVIEIRYNLHILIEINW